MSLSERAQDAAQPNKGLVAVRILQDLWNPATNPNGYVSLGLAENTLMHKSLLEHLNTNFAPSEHALTYGDGFGGSKRLKSAIARFLTAHLAPVETVDPSHITVTNGCSSALEKLAFAFANPGDAFLLGRPHYGTFIPDLTSRTGGKVVTVAFGEADPLGEYAVQAYERALTESHREGTKVAGLVLCHPHNPLGRCYPRSTLVDLMRLCEKYKIHFICDEIYALSVWTNNIDAGAPVVPFESALSLDPQGIIDPSLVHVVWGMSKDFGANGLRLGAVISQHNPTLHTSMTASALYSSSSLISDHISANILEDEHWCRVYLEENRRKLAQHYELAARWAEQHNITYSRGTNAAFFLWIDLGRAYQNRRPGCEVADIDDEVMDALLEHKVFLARGDLFGSEHPGWFRIVFSQDQTWLEEGLKRIVVALDHGRAPVTS